MVGKGRETPLVGAITEFLREFELAEKEKERGGVAGMGRARAGRVRRGRLVGVVHIYEGA